MGHDIEVAADGTASFFSGEGIKPWHGLGTVVEGTLTAEEALTAAGLDWTVSLRPTSWEDPDGNFHRIEDRYTVVRDSDNKAYEVVGGDYVPYQNFETFSFFDSVTDKTGEAHYTTAGSLAGGKKVFMTAKIGETFTVGGNDAHELFLIMANSHDGKHTFNGLIAPVRVVCANTMQMAISQAKSTFALRHVGTLAGKVQQARDTLGLAYRYQEAFEAEVERLLAIDVSIDQFREIVGGLLPEQKRAKERHMDDLIGSWLHETTPIDSFARGNGWSAMNAATYWTDNVKASRSEEARFKSVNGGFAFKFRNDVRERVLALA